MKSICERIIAAVKSAKNADIPEIPVATRNLLVEKFEQGYPDDVRPPFVLLTGESELLLEWVTPACPTIDINIADQEAYYHSFREDGSDFEKDFDLSKPGGWPALFEFISSKEFGG